ncbi:MAG TPA: hypothetical protein VMH90_00180 [Thermoplasmata archaeon]|nr:hypothetical protein [Thermoplasmata archaeon]
MALPAPPDHGPRAAAPPEPSFDLRPANDPSLLPPVRGPGGRFRGLLIGFALGIAGLGALALGIASPVGSVLRWPLPDVLDAVGIPLAAGFALYVGWPRPSPRRAITLTIGPAGVEVRFTDGSTEAIRWDDPDLDAGIGEGAGVARAPDRVLIGLWGPDWATPALITSDARDAILRAAAGRGLRQETVTEDSGAGRRTTVYLMPARSTRPRASAASSVRGGPPG